MGYRDARPDPDPRCRGQLVTVDTANDPVHRPVPPPPPVLTGHPDRSGHPGRD